MADNKKKTPNDTVDQDVPLTNEYNNLLPPATKDSDLEEYYKNQPIPPPANVEDVDDGKSHRNLNFDSSQAEQPSRFAKLRQFMGSLPQRFSDNLQKSDQINSDATKMMMDRVMMQNPNRMGPPIPNEPMPAELAQSQMVANGVMGSVAPMGKFAQLSKMMGGAGKEAAAAELQAATKAMFEKNAPAAQQVAEQLGLQKTAPVAAQTMNDIARSQQALGRNVDFAQRLAAQKAALKAAALKRYLGK